MNSRSRCALVSRMLILLLLLAPVAAIAQAVTGVGFQAITIHDPVNGGTTPGYVFYPSAQPSKITWRGPYELHATPDAPPIASDAGICDTKPSLARASIVSKPSFATSPINAISGTAR